MNKIAMALWLVVLFMIPGLSKAKDSECLMRIMYAESHGQSIDGVIGLGEAAVNRSRRTGTSLCRLIGVHRANPPFKMMAYYVALARAVLSSEHYTVKNADSWNTGKKPKSAGEITRQIGNHVFYVMADM